MKIFANTLKQRHLRARHRYWQDVYTGGGFHRVPLPCLEMYSDEGEIVPCPPFPHFETPMLTLLPRMAASTEIVNWSTIAAGGRGRDRALCHAASTEIVNWSTVDVLMANAEENRV